MTVYTENPLNLSDVKAFVKTEIDDIKKIFFSADRILFYDTCSFQRHADLEDTEQKILIKYYKDSKTGIFITRCVLMELASEKHLLAERAVDFIKNMNMAGLDVVLYNEEDTYDILADCFSVNEKINGYLIWAVRTARSPVSIITETLKIDAKLSSEIIEGKNAKTSDLYRRFFTAVRGNKERRDNLGEELISICVHILSYLPGIRDGKLCVLTDDKGAAGRIDCVMRRTNPKNRGAKILLLSTPKLVQHMFQEHIEMSEDEMVRLISQGTSGNVTVMGLTAYDLKINGKISMTGRELARKIIEPGGINIVF